MNPQGGHGVQEKVKRERHARRDDMRSKTVKSAFGKTTRVLSRAIAVAAAAMTLGAAPTTAVQASQAVWVPSIANPPQGFTSVELFDDGTGYVHRTNSNGTFFHTTEDGGVTWLPVDVPPGYLVDFAAAEIGYSANSRTLWRTDDGAGSWAETGLPEPPAGREDSIEGLFAAGHDGGLVALGITSEVDDDGSCPFNPFTARVDVAVSTDGTRTWERVEVLDVPGKVQMLEFMTEDFGVAIVTEMDWTQTGDCSFTGRGTLGQLVYVLEPAPDGGALQARLVLDCQPRTCGSVGIAAEGAFTVGFVDGGIARTTDGGETFTFSHLDATLADAVSDAANEDRIFWVTEIEFATPEVGYAVTNGRGMWRTDDGGATWVTEPSTRDVYDLGIADVAVAGPDHALAGGPTLVLRRQPTP